MTQYPKSPHHQIDFDQHLERNMEARATKCPNF